MLMWLVSVVYVHADEAAALKAIERLEGKVTRDDDAPGKPVTGVELSGPQVTDASLKVLKDIKELQFLGLGGTSVTDKGLKELKDLKKLQTLLLLGTDFTDEGLKELKEFKQLRTLVLSKTKVTEAGIADLKKALPELTVTEP
jgi:hypothetical protein